jgi:hypothetical protein
MAYLLMDSWYTSVKIIDVASTKGLQVIGGLKTNRVLFWVSGHDRYRVRSIRAMVRFWSLLF